MRFGFLVMGVVLVLASSLAAQTADEAAVNNRVDGLFETTRDGDADANAAFYHENGVIAARTDLAVGLANIRKFISETLADGGIPVTFTRHATTVLSSTVAVTHGSYENVESGNNGHVTITLVKEGNEWFVVVYQNAPAP